MFSVTCPESKLKLQKTGIDQKFSWTSFAGHSTETPFLAIFGLFHTFLGVFPGFSHKGKSFLKEIFTKIGICPEMKAVWTF